MAIKSAELQARDFVYELNNCASEYGFRKDELWEVGLITEKDKIKLEKKYYPTISALMAPEVIPDMLDLVRSKLQTFAIDITSVKSVVIKGTLQYLVAYSAGRVL